MKRSAKIVEAAMIDIIQHSVSAGQSVFQHMRQPVPPA
jgi:hypothetical protein